MKTGFKGIRNNNGRPVGSPNAVSAEIRERFNLLVQNNIDKLQQDLEQLEPFQRIKIIIEMAKFILPNLKSTEIIAEQDNDNFRPVIINLGSGINPNAEENDN